MSGKNFSPEQLMRLLLNSKGNNGSVAEDLVKNQMSSEQRSRVEAILRDKDALNALLSSEQAKELLKRMGKGQ